IDLVVHWGRYDLKEGRSRLYLNDGRMNFHDATLQFLLTEDGTTIKGVADVNQDGLLDLVGFAGKSPTIWLNHGKGDFRRNPEAFSGLGAASKPNYTSWGLAVLADFDNDGIGDLIWNGRNFLWV